MRVALLVSGFFRTFRQNHYKLKQLLLNHFDVDVFLYVTTNEHELDHYRNPKYAVGDLLSLTSAVDSIVHKEQPVFQDVIRNNIHQMWYKIHKLNELRKAREKQYNFKYDCVIRWRPDITLLEDNESKTLRDVVVRAMNEDGALFIPSAFELSYNSGVDGSTENTNDQLAIGCPDAMDIYCDLFLRLNHFHDHGIKNSSHMLHVHLRERRLMYTSFSLEYKLTLSSCHVIAISGDSGSGKSTLSKAISALFRLEALHLECDRYHKWERHDEKWKSMTHLNPEANLLDKMNNDLFRLKFGSDVFRVDYDHKTGKFTEPKKIEPKSNIILCGLHSLYNSLNNCLLNLRLFMLIDENLRVLWKIKRDITERKYSVEEAYHSICKRREDSQKFIQQQAENADVLINYELIGSGGELWTLEQLQAHDWKSEPQYRLRLHIMNAIDVDRFLRSVTTCKYDVQVSGKVVVSFSENTFHKSDTLKACGYCLDPSLLHDGYTGLIQLLVLCQAS